MNQDLNRRGPEHDWDALTRAEPGLAELELNVAAYAVISLASQRSHCQLDFYRDWLYAALVPLVGWRRKYDPSVPPWLATAAAFDTARFHLQWLSGPCRDCEDTRSPTLNWAANVVNSPSDPRASS